MDIDGGALEIKQKYETLWKVISFVECTSSDWKVRQVFVYISMVVDKLVVGHFVSMLVVEEIDHSNKYDFDRA